MLLGQLCRALLDVFRFNPFRGRFSCLCNIASHAPTILYAYRQRPDGTSCVSYASDAFREIYGIEPQELSSDASRIFNIIHPDDHDAIVKSLQKSATELTLWQHEYRIRFPDGKVRWLASQASPKREKDGSVTWYGTITDISANNAEKLQQEEYLTKLEALVEQRTQALAIAKEAAETAIRAKSTFLSNLSHELCTPMHTIIGLTHLLTRTQLDPAQADKLTKVQNAAHHLHKLMNSLLDLAQLEADKLTLAQQNFTLGNLRQHLNSFTSDKLSARAVKMRYNIDPGLLKIALRGDPQRLLQVLLALIDNAFKFTEHGSVTLSVHIEDESESTLQLAFGVRDTGMGIAKEALNRIFIPFEQGDGSSTRRFSGTGLGLTISQRLIRQMGGALRVESSPGAGSNFSFSLLFPKAHYDTTGSSH